MHLNNSIKLPAYLVYTAILLFSSSTLMGNHYAVFIQPPQSGQKPVMRIELGYKAKVSDLETEIYRQLDQRNIAYELVVIYWFETGAASLHGDQSLYIASSFDYCLRQYNIDNIYVHIVTIQDIEAGLDFTAIENALNKADSDRLKSHIKEHCTDHKRNLSPEIREERLIKFQQKKAAENKESKKVQDRDEGKSDDIGLIYKGQPLLLCTIL